MENQQLINAYKKSFKQLNKVLFQTKAAGINLFVEHLKFLRDSLILNTQEDLSVPSPTNTRITTLSTAIAEFEAIAVGDKKDFHWDNFCMLMNQNMGDWLELHDSI